MTDDRSPLRDLSVRYATAVDRRHMDLFLSVFDPDATLLVHRPDGSPGEGATALRGHGELRRVIELISRYDKTFHLLGQGTYEIDGDQATGEVYCVAHHHVRAATDDRDHVMYIRYRDHYRRIAPDAWRIAVRDVLVDWSETRTISRPSADGPRS